MSLENLPADVQSKLAELGFKGAGNGAVLPITNGPPGGVAPTELFRKLMEMPRPSRAVDFPRRGADGKPVCQVEMVILSESELNEVRAAADRVAKKMLGDAQKEGEQNLGYQDIYRNVSVVELLWRACRSSKSELHVPAFLTPTLMRKHFTTDELAVLMDAYLQLKTECGPIISSMTEQEMDAWLKVLGEGASRVPLSLLSSETKSDLLMRSAALLRSFWTASGSVGSPAEGSSTALLSPDEGAPAAELNPGEEPGPVPES